MEAKRSSKKRKQPHSSDRFAGIFTRSKSQIFIHRNRSGRTRSNTARRTNREAKPDCSEWSPRVKPKIELTHESLDCDDEISRISIKDLRLRRVFSPASVIECCLKLEESSDVEGFQTGFHCKDQKVNDTVNPSSSATAGDSCSDKDDGNVDMKPTERREIDKFEIGFSCKDQSLSDINPNLSSTDYDCCVDKDYKNYACFDDTTPLKTAGIEKFDQGFPFKAQDSNDTNPCLMEECVQMTPPDADIFGEPEIDENGENRLKSVLQATNRDLGKPLNGCIRQSDGSVHEGFRANIDRRSDSISKSKLVLNPHSRLKVFKTPDSFSYRRLLPFLMDIAKDNSCDLKNGQCPKLEKVLEVKPLSPLLASHGQEISIDKSSASDFPVESHIVDSGTPPKPILTPENSSSNDSEPNSTSPEDIVQTQMSFDSQKEPTLKVDPSISDRLSKLKPTHDNESPAHGTGSPVSSLCSPVSPEPLSREGAIEVYYLSPIDAKEKCKMSGIESIADAVSLDQVSSQIEAILPKENLAVSVAKGILKRNPRGCRGICTCLNCASFRLHAERAFEFSKNQMQDAEEVALELIKELSYLRNMLEKSTDGANDQAVVQVNQVKEACWNASKAEELAKSRLSQMNYDLNIHCRITCSQRPRVSFANYVEGKVIPKADLPSK